MINFQSILNCCFKILGSLLQFHSIPVTIPLQNSWPSVTVSKNNLLVTSCNTTKTQHKHTDRQTTNNDRQTTNHRQTAEEALPQNTKTLKKQVECSANDKEANTQVKIQTYICMQYFLHRGNRP